MSYEGEKFLLKLYKDLEKAEEVKYADKRSKKRSGNKFELLKKYLDRLERQQKVLDGDHLEMEKYLKNRYYDKYIIKEKDIPNSYWEHQQRILLERGYGHIEYDSYLKHEEAKILIEEQKKSLEKWIDYLMKENTSYPMWARYWAFQGMLKLGKYDKEKHVYNKRSKGTVTPFIDLNPEALAHTIGAVQEYYEGKTVDDSELTKLIENGNFGKIYAYNTWKLIEDEKKNNKNRLDTEDGVWKVFQKGDAKRLVKSLDGKGTGWCIAEESMASEYLEYGNMHIYYTKDIKGNYTMPRVCIRQEGNQIVEVRGIEQDQNLEAEMNDITDKKLDEFEDKEEYKKKVQDMKKLTEIYDKNEKKQELTVDDYRFIYSNIKGFGWKDDPRIDELRSSHPITNKKLALEIVKSCDNPLKYMSEELRNDKDVIFEAAINDYHIMDSDYISYEMKCDEELNERLNSNKQYVIQAIGDTLSFKNINNTLKNDREVVLTAVRKRGRYLREVSEDYKNDKEVVLAAIESYSINVLQYASPELKNDKEVVLAAIKTSHGKALQYASPELKNDKEVVLAAIKQDAGSLQYASEELKNDKEIVLSTLKCDILRNGARCIGEELRNNKEFMLEMINKYKLDAEYAGEDLKKDKEYMMASVKKRGASLYHASPELKNDKEVVLAAVNNGNGDAIRFASPELKKDEDIIKTSQETLEAYRERFDEQKNGRRR